jgi:hypothetical protein
MFFCFLLFHSFPLKTIGEEEEEEEEEEGLFICESCKYNTS